MVWWHPFLWLLNGLLVTLYFLADHWPTVLAVPLAAWLLAGERRERRPMGLAAVSAALAATVFGPHPVPYAVGLMLLAAAVAVHVERHDPLALRWQAYQALGLYGLMGLGFRLWRLLPADFADPSLVTGLGYLLALIGIAMYVYPIGYLALLAQGLFVHPPLGRPEDVVREIRTRGRR